MTRSRVDRAARGAADTEGHLAAHGMVAAADADVAEIGLEVLRRGGNAVDAAVTMAFAVGVVEPGGSGIGGGGLLIFHDVALPSHDCS